MVSREEILKAIESCEAQDCGEGGWSDPYINAEAATDAVMERHQSP